MFTTRISFAIGVDPSSAPDNRAKMETGRRVHIGRWRLQKIGNWDKRSMVGAEICFALRRGRLRKGVDLHGDLETLAGTYYMNLSVPPFST